MSISFCLQTSARPSGLPHTCIRAALPLALLIAGQAQANNGVMLPGYGAKAVGMGGVSIALPQDAAASANNPAGMALVGNRVDFDVTFIRAPIETEVGPGRYKDTADIAVPTGGFSRVINEDFSWGISMFAQGVLLNYKEPVFGSRNTKSDFQQTVLAPTLTWRMAPGHYLGFSPRLAHQRLEIAGLEGLGFSTPGSDKAYGAGFALGYLGELNDRFSVGLAYSSPIWFQKLDRYRDLIPEGRLNMPQVVGAGLAYRLTPAITLAADYQWINWSGEKTYGNRMTEGGQFGDSDGPGFGWRDQRIVRLGAAWELDRHWTVRAGASLASELIPKSEATLASLAPLMQRDHYMVGATYGFDGGLELTGSYMKARSASVHGEGASAGVNVRTEVDYVFNLGIGYRF
ncbi:TPA: outer membrane protein transport protein [Pseudomonas aeruginosa]|nr:outer membrane protein transport protein [Pseudomonas aeruginosa]